MFGPTNTHRPTKTRLNLGRRPRFDPRRGCAFFRLTQLLVHVFVGKEKAWYCLYNHLFVVLSTAPDRPPQSLRITNINSTELTASANVTFSPVPLASRHGVITHYRVSVLLIRTKSIVEEFTKPVKDQAADSLFSLNSNVLRPYRVYTVSALAITSNNLVGPSTSVDFTTLESGEHKASLSLCLLVSLNVCSFCIVILFCFKNWKRNRHIPKEQLDLRGTVFI